MVRLTGQVDPLTEEVVLLIGEGNARLRKSRNLVASSHGQGKIADKGCKYIFVAHMHLPCLH